MTAKILVFAGVCASLAGCSAGVQVAVPSGATVSACRNPPWPAKVSGQPVTGTDPDTASVHAWGDPAIVARCGVAALGPTTDPCVSVDGVDWVSRTLSDGAAFTTFGTDPALEVLVPKAYAPEPLVLPAFSAAAKSLPRNDLRCR